MQDLNLDFELVDLCLHELLSDLSQEFQVELYEAAFHDFLPELDRHFLALLDNLPEFVGQGIRALMKFLLGLVVLTQVGVLVGEAVEVFDELVEDGLLAVTGVQELQELHLELRLPNAGLLPLETDIAEHSAHLTFVVLRKITPHLDDHWFKVIVQVVAVGKLRRDGGATDVVGKSQT